MSSKYKIGIIGGTGFSQSQMFNKSKSSIVSTPYGKVKVFEEGNLVFLHRHGEKYLAPHRINYRANIYALKKKNVKFIIATAACGSLNWGIRPGDLVLLSDFIDLTKNRIQTFNPAGKPNYLDISEPYSELLRTMLIKAAGRIHKRAVYACAEGPRFETRAEIRAYQTLGCDVVGMTQVPEVVLAKEAGIPYAVLAVATNYAAGLQSKISDQEVAKMMSEKSSKIGETIRKVCREL